VCNSASLPPTSRHYSDFGTKLSSLFGLAKSSQIQIQLSIKPIAPNLLLANIIGWLFSLHKQLVRFVFRQHCQIIELTFLRHCRFEIAFV
jgi:hypothetical protein